jgi:glycosyltransferase involved in cell wall biosynthesis
MDEKILSICIPTYNRGEILKIFLSKLSMELRSINTQEVEIVVSDNCSTDNTAEVVKEAISEGMRIKYHRNNVNLGMDGNFVSCLKLATGKYVWVLGDDDFLVNGSLGTIITLLKKDNYGLVHIKLHQKDLNDSKVYLSSKEFLADVTYWITFISSNIVARKFVSEIDFEKYMGTYFTLVPLYLTAAQKSDKNLMVYSPIFSDSNASETNGGYNYFKVFINNYLGIRKEFFANDPTSFEKEKKSLFTNHIMPFIDKLLIRRKVGNFKTENGWFIILRNFGGKYYFYTGFLKYYYKILKNRLI